MKVLYRQTASDDIVRQFRYYLLTAEAAEIAHAHTDRAISFGGVWTIVRRALRP